MSRQEARIIALLEEIRDAVVEEDESGDETYNCGFNGCERTVTSAETRCWQHQD